MKRIGLIGLGVISKFYKQGLQESPDLCLCAVCDQNENAPSRSFYPDLPFFTNYQEMILCCKPDCIVISTTPDAHFSIACFALQNGVDVLVEKPATVSMAQLEELMQMAKANHRRFDTLFHWQFGSEVQRFNSQYDPYQITEATINVVDPYSADAVTINPDRRGLLGTWIDTGINCLSLLKTWRPFDQVRILSANAVKCPESNQPLFCRVCLDVDGLRATVQIDWRRNQNHKETTLLYNGRTIVIDHSNQCFYDEGVKTDCFYTERMQQHYIGCFSHRHDADDEEATRRIHQLLFEVDKQL